MDGAESRVSQMVKSLSLLEDDLDSITAKAAEIKKAMSLRASSEIESATEEVRKIATADAELLIKSAQEKADAESARISAEGKKRLEEVRVRIDASFDDAVQETVSAILKS